MPYTVMIVQVVQQSWGYMGSTKMLDSGRAFHGSKYSTSFSGFNQNKPWLFQLASDDTSNSNATSTTLSGLINHNTDQTLNLNMITPSLQRYLVTVSSSTSLIIVKTGSLLQI